MRTLEELTHLLNKDADTKVYDTIDVPVDLFSDTFKSDFSIPNQVLSTTVTIDYRDTLFPDCYHYACYLRSITYEVASRYNKNTINARIIFTALKRWCEVFNTYNKIDYWKHDSKLLSRYLEITHFISKVDSMYTFLNDPEQQRRADEVIDNLRNLNKSMLQLDTTELDDPFGEKKGENKMKKKDQKDLLIFVKSIIEEVIEGIDVNDRNGKELYSLANQTKEEIEKGMNTMEEFGKAYEELHRKSYKDYKVREESSKLLATMLDTYKKKNADYGDSFAESVGWFGYEAAYVRIYDKVMRYISLSTKDPQVVSESKADTLLDLANYCVMFYAILNNADYESSLRYIMNEFNNNALNIDDTVCYSTSNEPVIVTPSHYYIPVGEWKETIEYWGDDIPEMRDEVFKLAVSAIRIIVLSEVEDNDGN